MTPFELLATLAGRWAGRGRGQYPTIRSFEYEEETTFLVAPEYPMIRFEQRAWLLPDRTASHWELGFFRVVEGGAVELSTSQDSGRVEVLRGAVEAAADGIRLSLASTCLANDARVLETARIFTIRDDLLHYVKFMATSTTAVPSRMKHLEATLRRVTEGSPPRLVP